MIDPEKADPTSNASVSHMCELLEVDRRRFYEWRGRRAVGPTPAQQRDIALLERIRSSHTASGGT